MLVDELKKNYDLYNRELTKEETETLYGNVLEDIEDRMKAHKTVNTWKLWYVDMKGDIVKLPMLDNKISFLKEEVIKMFSRKV